MSNGTIEQFTGFHSFLSNFYPSPVTLDGEVYPTVEHAYQAAKTLDPNVRIQFQYGTPGAAKRLGRRVQLRIDWEDAKVGIMRELIARKFAPGTELAKQLIATGDCKLIEGNAWGDRFWGMCRPVSGRLRTEQVEWVGLNWLGELLMRQREALTGR